MDPLYESLPQQTKLAILNDITFEELELETNSEGLVALLARFYRDEGGEG